MKFKVATLRGSVVTFICLLSTKLEADCMETVLFFAVKGLRRVCEQLLITNFSCGYR